MIYIYIYLYFSSLSLSLFLKRCILGSLYIYTFIYHPYICFRIHVYVQEWLSRPWRSAPVNRARGLHQ